MNHRMRLAVLGLFVLAAAPVALADDLVHFTNGTFLKVQGYKVEGDMIRVTIGPDAAMAFPKNLVESIERAGRTIYPQGSSGPANVVTSSGVGGQASGGGQYIQTGEHQIPARFRKGASASPESGEVADEKAAATRNPQDFQLAGRRGMLRAVGRREMPVGESLVDADPTKQPPRPAKPKGFTSISARGFGASAPAPEPPADTAPPEAPTPPEAPDEGPDAGAESDGTASPD